MKVLITVNSCWNIINFREGLVKEFVGLGYDVVVATPRDSYVPKLCEWGVRFVEVKMASDSTRLFSELRAIFSYARILRCERPDYVLSFTAKPNIYVGLSAHFFPVNVISNIAGLGRVYSTNGFLRILVDSLYRLSLRRSKWIFFQNHADKDLLLRSRIVKHNRYSVLPGSGVDLDKFTYCEQSLDNKKTIEFVMICRLLWAKGIREFLAASNMLIEEGHNIECFLVGPIDLSGGGPSISELSDMLGAVVYLGKTDSVGKVIRDSDCIVLPSYYPEGVPRTLLEAAASGRPLITTDSVGCREAVEDRVNGFICKPEDPIDLLQAMKKFLHLNASARAEMGLESRRLAERRFNERFVIDEYCRVLNEP